MKHATANHSRRAFSLIELMVVIGIIVLLVGLTVAVSVTLRRKSEVSQTERALELLSMALQEWEMISERTITYGINNSPPGAVYMIQEVATVDELHDLMHKVVEIIVRNPSAKEILSRIDVEFLHEHGGELSVFDAWQNDFAVIFPGRKWNSITDPASLRDADGTIITDMERLFGSCVNGKICFVSAGPDGLYGDIASSLDANSDGVPDYQDNVYSYPLTKP